MGDTGGGEDGRAVLGSEVAAPAPVERSEPERPPGRRAAARPFQALPGPGSRPLAHQAHPNADASPSCPAPQLPELLALLADGPRRALAGLDPAVASRLEEIRLRAGQALMVGWAGGEAAVGEGGLLVSSPGAPAGQGQAACAQEPWSVARASRPPDPHDNGPAAPSRWCPRPYLVTPDDISRTLQLITRSSVYALEEELRLGYLTLRGGHRVGLAGETVLDQGRVRRLRHVGSLCLRIAREVLGAADPVMPFVMGQPQQGETAESVLVGLGPEAGALCTPRVHSALIASPPLAGKTTVLRDIARQLSEGVPRLGFPGVKVGVVDERSELAACYEGVPQLRVGPRTDVLDGCPKAEGMMMLVRAMSPQVIVTDEFGRPADVEAAREAMNSGVALITSAHAADLKELLRRPSLKDLLAEGAFRWIIILGESRGRGTVEAVFDGRTLEPVLAAPLAPGPAAGEGGDDRALAAGLPAQVGPRSLAACDAAGGEVAGDVAQALGRRPGAGGLHLVRPDGGL